MGRPFRRFVGKDSVAIYNYIPSVRSKDDDGLSKREILSDRTNALLVCLQWDEMCRPIEIPQLPSRRNGWSTKNAPLSEVFGDQYHSAKIMLLESVELLKEKSKDLVQAVIEDVLDEFDITENRQAVGEGLWQIILRRAVSAEVKQSLALEGMDISFLRKENFDRIIEKQSLRASIFFGSFESQDWDLLRGLLMDKWERMYEQAAAV